MARKTTSTSGRKTSGTTQGAKPAASRARQPAPAARKATPARASAVPKVAASKSGPSKTGITKTGASAKPKAIAGRPAAARSAAARQPVQNKQELRDRIEKLERANVVLRAKNREAIEASREAANRIDQLQEQLSRHEAAQPAPGAADAPEVGTDVDVSVGATPIKPARRGRKPRQRAEPADEPAAEAMPDTDDET